MNKSLLIPYIKELDNKTLDEAMPILEERGVRCPIDSLNWPQEYPYHPLTVVNAAHSDEAIFLDFFVRCNYLRAVNAESNSPVWEDSCVSFFVRPQPDGEYWSFHINCIGAINASRRTTRRPVHRLSTEEIDTIECYASCGYQPFREVEGLFTWNVVVRIPLSLIGVEYKGLPVLMKGNLYKCASGTSQPHFLSWNPVGTQHPDFHSPQSFGDIILE
ncbi:MAG: hypothetical protein HDS69_07860 [Bacteroidales bacterium]|nr:hypothetical protein [Bacteroidales bacterium]MBD5229928.1 hypothetical protein [Bacteroidales bacterium]MBD5235312.1 hypothetical protein [Barnesiella sp.]MBD5247456.1 hypothetical protein [Barnesiella sp.]MBD5258538.1 hypothetical protein [Barnesiella sp.]